MLFENARKTQNLRILRSKLYENVIFCFQIFLKIVLFKNIFFFKIVLFKKTFSSKSCFFGKFFFFKIMRFKNFNLLQNLTRCKNFNSNSDALLFFSVQNLTRKKIFNSKSAFSIVFPDSG